MMEGVTNVSKGSGKGHLSGGKGTGKKGKAPPPPPPSGGKGGKKTGQQQMPQTDESPCNDRDACSGCSVGGVLDCCAAHLAQLNIGKLARKEKTTPWEDSCARAFSTLIADAAVQGADWSRDSIVKVLSDAPYTGKDSPVGKIMQRAKRVPGSQSSPQLIARQSSALLTSQPVTAAIAPLAAKAPRMPLASFKTILTKNNVQGPKAIEETVSFIRAKPLAGPDFRSAEAIINAVEPAARQVFRRSLKSTGPTPSSAKNSTTAVRATTQTYRDAVASVIANNPRAGSILADSIPRAIPGEFARLATLRLNLCRDPDFQIMAAELKCGPSHCSTAMCEPEFLLHLSSMYVPERPMDGLPAGTEEARLLLKEHLVNSGQPLACGIEGKSYEAAVRTHLESSATPKAQMQQPASGVPLEGQPCTTSTEFWAKMDQAMLNMASFMKMLKEPIPAGVSSQEALKSMPISSLLLLLTVLKIVSESPEYLFAQASNLVSDDYIRETRELDSRDLLQSSEAMSDFLSEPALLRRYVTRPLTVSKPSAENAQPKRKLRQTEEPVRSPILKRSFPPKENDGDILPVPPVNSILERFNGGINRSRVGGGLGYLRQRLPVSGGTVQKEEPTQSTTQSSTPESTTTDSPTTTGIRGMTSRIAGAFGSVLNVAAGRAKSRKKEETLRRAHPQFFQR